MNTTIKEQLKLVLYKLISSHSQLGKIWQTKTSEDSRNELYAILQAQSPITKAISDLLGILKDLEPMGKDPILYPTCHIPLYGEYPEDCDKDKNEFIAELQQDPKKE